MGIGLEVYAPNGSLISDTNTRAMKVLGSVTLTSGSGDNGTISHPALALGPQFWVIKTPLDAVGSWTLIVRTRDATTLEWFFNTPFFNGNTGVGRPPFVVLFGIR